MSIRPAAGWGPEHKRAALCITFDNFGEACEIEIGEWGDRAVGAHFTAEMLPDIVEKLDGLPVTYCMEASNTLYYADAMKAWVAAGNEIAIHGWRHEMWAKTEPAARRDVLRRSIDALRAIGVEPVGMRPPGGMMPADAWAELEEFGLLYCSEVSADGVRRVGNVVSLPFVWPEVDAFWFEPIAGQLRVGHGFDAAVYPPDHWRDLLDALLDRLVTEGTQATILFHPHQLGGDTAKLEILAEFVAKLKRADVWVPRMRDMAEFVAQMLTEEQRVAA